MVIHVDMDAFYASVEERDDPSLRGKPVIVGGSVDKRGVVATANYIARTYGVHSAMPAVTARRLCPDGIFIPGRMSHYIAISHQIKEVFANYTPLIEPLSLDEAFLDVTNSRRLYGNEVKIAQRIKIDMLQAVDLPASFGIAPNKFLAKLASDIDKPNGFRIVKTREIQQFLDPLPVSRVWGIGKKTQAKLNAFGLKTIRDIRVAARSDLQTLFGNQTEHMLALANGQDERNVVADHQAKSISRETTFTVDVSDFDSLKSNLMTLVEDVAHRLRASELIAGNVNLKIRLSDFSTITRSRKLATASSNTQALWQASLELLQENIKPQNQIRLLGMGTGLLKQTHEQVQWGMQTDLFATQKTQRFSKLDALGDQITKRFGKDKLRRAVGTRTDH